MIYYIHGFNSSIKKEKLALLSRTLRETVQGLAYDSSLPLEVNLKSLRDQASNATCFIGTSLGGYYAQILGTESSTQTILINPAIHPMETLLQCIGENSNYVSGRTYDLSSEVVDSYNQNLLFTTETLVIVSLGDEVIDNNRTVNELSNKCQLEVLEGGSHSFDQYDEVKDTMITFMGTPTLAL